MLAVLQTVIDDVRGSALRRAAGHRGAIDRREEDRALAYLRSDDRAWPFSFENVCEALGVEASMLRRALETMGAGYSTHADLKSGALARS